MTASIQQLQEWLNAKEDEHLEFKEAKTNFHFDKRDHIATHAGCSLQEIMAAFPRLTRNQIQSYLKQLRADELIHPPGRPGRLDGSPGLGRKLGEAARHDP
ncbi:MAG: hypothetical protein ACLP53_32840, partial [Isosphaeraceae bacterium]